jgi:phospholipid/cholesterol/gamma-HCH transport system substrate-binding protein
MSLRPTTILAAVLVLALIGGAVAAVRSASEHGRTQVVAYFDNSNGIFEGDEVRILGVPVGKINKIEPQPLRAKITFWFDGTVDVPADAKAVILSPGLVTDRAIQLTPAYTGGPPLREGAVIPQERTAVPVEWDDFRQQLEKLTDTLQPNQPGGVSTLGAFVNTAADNLRGQGVTIRDTVLKLSQAFSALGDHSSDIFSTVKNLSILVSALQSSTDLMGQLNRNLGTVSAVLADDPAEVAHAISDLNTAIGDVRGFLADNREGFGTFSDKLSSISTALDDSLDDVKELLHLLPNALQNFMNVYEPAHGSITGVMAVNNFANPITFLCGAIQAASRLGNEQSAKLCVQYLAPIIKNRQYNFLPVGMNPLVNAQARPNEITYSEDWMRPDFVPPATEVPGPADPGPGPALAAESVIATDPAAGLPGMMAHPAGTP